MNVRCPHCQRRFDWFPEKERIDLVKRIAEITQGDESQFDIAVFVCGRRGK